MAGLGYCDKLIFHTSARGEEKESIITWNGIKLREIVNDPSQHPSSEQLIDEITNVEYVVADKEEHFFEVIMEDVSFESDDLLDEQQVIKYLSAVAPVPYANYFIFSSKIKEFAKENSFRIDEYNVSVNGNQLFKPYRTILYEGHSNDDKKEYDQIKTALKMVKQTGYGIAAPSLEDMKLEKPEIIKQGSRYGIKLKAKAASIHMIKVEVESTFEPIIGSELQSKELIDHLTKNDNNTDIWKSEIFGRSLDVIVQEGIQAKLSMMPDNVRFKLCQTLTKIINKGSSNMIAIVL